MIMTIYKSISLLLLLLCFSIRSNSQVFLYFQDSPSADYYDFSWMELTSPSELERKGTDLRKFPVESVIPPVQGINSLRLKWKSVSGGDWVAIAAGNNWTEKDLSGADTLLFWLYSVEGLNSADLPRIFMEDINNVRSTKQLFSSWCDNLAGGQWVRVKVPMSLFLGAGDPVDFTKIKTIGFAQNTLDGIQHTLLIDNMRVFTGSATSPAASRPAGLSATGYDSHIELRWNPVPEAFVSGYTIQRSVNGGASFSMLGVTGKTDTLFTDYVRDLGTPATAYYRVFALNASGEMSPASDTVHASTRAFTDDELLNMLQQYTFRYFWDFAHPASGMARERNTSGNIVTTGGSGFGIMALLVGIERGFITREQGIVRMQKVLAFLQSADRFHGAWPHWIDGNTGKVVPFSAQDDGGDLVETGFLMEGLLTARQYFNHATAEEQDLVQKITGLWNGVEWDWYRQNNSNVLYWHWSPDYGWAINMQIRGWNEAAMIYMLAVASPTHGVPASLWQSGWAGNPGYLNGKTFYGYKLYVGPDEGGPLFFTHYSFLGFDPRHKKDDYANYYVNNQNHTLINRAYCIANPLGFTGYNENCWGLTASDDPDGYLAHEPVAGRDNGTITPTASLSSMPYTPVESMNAFKYLYRNLGKNIWGPMGFYDAFNQDRNWYATSYLAIDQGPIIGMIENYRSQLLWNNFMANPEIQQALDAIGFTDDVTTGIPNIGRNTDLVAMPNPMHQQGTIQFNLDSPQPVSLYLQDLSGRTVSVLFQDRYSLQGINRVPVEIQGIEPGIYVLKLVTSGKISDTIKLIHE
jgi:exo beta-1,2-glucooligosaccharide sophorohydrolase (non-reducing end)